MSSSESYLKTELLLLRRNTDPEVAEIRVTKRKAKRGEQAVKVVSCSACGCIMASNCGHELFEFRNTRNKIIVHGVYG